MKKFLYEFVFWFLMGVLMFLLVNEAFAVDYPRFDHPGYPASIDGSWPKRYDNLHWELCVPRGGKWYRHFPPTTIHMNWDLNNIRGSVKVLRVLVCPDYPEGFTSESDSRPATPMLPFITVWSINAPEGTGVDWYFDDTHYIGTTYSQVMPRGVDPSHPYARLILSRNGILDPARYFARINGVPVGVWYDATDKDNNVIAVDHRGS